MEILIACLWLILNLINIIYKRITEKEPKKDEKINATTVGSNKLSKNFPIGLKNNTKRGWTLVLSSIISSPVR